MAWWDNRIEMYANVFFEIMFSMVLDVGILNELRSRFERLIW